MQSAEPVNEMNDESESYKTKKLPVSGIENSAKQSPEQENWTETGKAPVEVAAKEPAEEPVETDGGRTKEPTGEAADSGGGSGKQPEPGLKGFFSAWIIIFAIYIGSLFLTGSLISAQVESIPYSSFINYVEKGEVDDLVISEKQVRGKFKNKKDKSFMTVRLEDPGLAERLNSKSIKFEARLENSIFGEILPWLLAPFIIFMLMGLFSSRAGKDGMGFGFSSISKNKAKVYMENKVKSSFNDVAGLVEAKEELEEIIGFLKEPEKYTRLGGHLPKGILLVGPPGTGKTLLARAVAGEAGVPFFSISGSEFVELFVGVGAARVRDLFSQAQKNAPCIIFIDELDALGRARGLGGIGGGSHDEKEQTLNQLLVEMDGFDPKQGVILIAATNRPEILDAALLRAGRFDRHVLVDRPDKKDRAEILRVHLRNVINEAGLNIDEIAAATPGFTGADLANLVNEASLLATRRNADAVEACDFTLALERVIAGLEKRNRLLNPHERRVVAFHEMGHALVSISIPGTDPIHKVSIIPRGIAGLGYTMQRPTEDRFLMSRSELKNKLAVLLGGRAAEMIVFEEISTGAADDLVKASEIARSMVTRYGMVKSLGPVSYESESSPYLSGAQSYLESRQFSEETRKEIDNAVRSLINEALERALRLLKARRNLLDAAADLLMQKESLDQDDLNELCRKQDDSERNFSMIPFDRQAV